MLQRSPSPRTSGSGWFQFWPQGGPELKGQRTVADHLGQPARFTSLSGLKQGQNALERKREATHSAMEKQSRSHLCKPQGDTESWLERLEDEDILHVVYFFPCRF